MLYILRCSRSEIEDIGHPWHDLVLPHSVIKVPIRQCTRASTDGAVGSTVPDVHWPDVHWPDTFTGRTYTAGYIYSRPASIWPRSAFGLTSARLIGMVGSRPAWSGQGRTGTRPDRYKARLRTRLTEAEAGPKPWLTCRTDHLINQNVNRPCTPRQSSERELTNKIR